MSDVLLEVTNIKKRYGAKPVIKDATLTVEKGQAIALVGVNGSGKSTLLRIMAGLTNADRGTVKLAEGADVGFIPDHFEKINMTIRTFIKYMAGIEGKKNVGSRAEKYYQMFYIEKMLDIPMKHLSKGTLQKVAVIQALLSDKQMLFLDEPLSGQDMMSQMAFVAEMKRCKEAGMAIVMSCHERLLIEEVADRIFQIKEGIISDGSDYVYGENDRKGVFFIRTADSAEYLEQQIRVHIPELVAAVEGAGGLYKVEAELAYTERLLGFFLQNKIRITKYEERE